MFDYRRVDDPFLDGGFHRHGGIGYGWMVDFMENPTEMGDLGVPYFRKPPNDPFKCIGHIYVLGCFMAS